MNWVVILEHSSEAHIKNREGPLQQLLFTNCNRLRYIDPALFDAFVSCKFFTPQGTASLRRKINRCKAPREPFLPKISIAEQITVAGTERNSETCYLFSSFGYSPAFHSERRTTVRLVFTLARGNNRKRPVYLRDTPEAPGASSFIRTASGFPVTLPSSISRATGSVAFITASDPARYAGIILNTVSVHTKGY